MYTPSLELQSRRGPAAQYLWKSYAAASVQAGPPPAVLSTDEELFFASLERPSHPATTVYSGPRADWKGKESIGRQGKAPRLSKYEARRARATFNSDDDDDDAIQPARTGTKRSAAATGSREKSSRKRAKQPPPVPVFADLQRLAPTNHPLQYATVLMVDAAVETAACDMVHGWYGAETSSRVRYREDLHYPPMPFPDSPDYAPKTWDMVLFEYLLPSNAFQRARPANPLMVMHVGGFSRNGSYFISTPNASYIPYFPERPMETVRWAIHQDGLLGAQEYTRIPRSLTAREGLELYCAFIPRRPLDRGDSASILWHNVDHWFCPAPDALVQREDRYLLKPYIAEALQKPVGNVCELIKQYMDLHVELTTEEMRAAGKDDATIHRSLETYCMAAPDRRAESEDALQDHFYKYATHGHPYLRGLDVAIRHIFGFLQIHGMPLVQAKLAARELQRYCLEARGICNYIDAHNETVLHTEEFNRNRPLRWVVGAITHEAFTLEYLRDCRVPVWFVTEWNGNDGLARMFDAQKYADVPSVDRLVTMTSPHRMACLSRHPDSLPYIYEGRYHDHGWLARVHAYSSIGFRVNAPLETRLYKDDDYDYDPLFARPDKMERVWVKLRSLDHLKSIRAPEPPKGHPFEKPGLVEVPGDEKRPIEVFPDGERPLPRIAGVATALDNSREEDENQECVAFQATSVAILAEEGPYNTTRTDCAVEANSPDSTADRADTGHNSPGQCLTPTLPACTPPPSSTPPPPPPSSTPLPPPPPSSTAPPPPLSTAPPLPSTHLSANPAGGTAQAWPSSTLWKGERTRARRDPIPWTTSTYDHRNAVPTTTPAWQAAVDKYSQKLGVNDDLGERDAARCFPTPTILVNPVREAKRASMIHTYVLMLNMLLENARKTEADDTVGEASIAVGAPVLYKLYTNEWKSILWVENTRRARPDGPVASGLRAVQGIFGGKLDIDVLAERLQAPYYIFGEEVQPGAVPSAKTLSTMLWHLQETLFRKDVMDLDERVRTVVVTKAEEAERLRPIFDSRTYWDGDILSVRGDGHRNTGLVAQNWQERMRYVRALVDVMESWSPSLWPQVVHVARLQPMLPSQAVWVENYVALFYMCMLRYELKRKVVPPPRRAVITC
ncbi:hypothetical protein HDZ31DRAFT_44912 [Schizophyllum fasciatum]